MEVPGAGGAMQGATDVAVADVDPRLGDSAGSLLKDLVVCGVGAGILRSAAPGETALAPGSLSAMGPGISGQYLSGSLGSSPSPINRRWVRDKAEFVCS
jgi:hypothetical protein